MTKEERQAEKELLDQSMLWQEKEREDQKAAQDVIDKMAAAILALILAIRWRSITVANTRSILADIDAQVAKYYAVLRSASESELLAIAEKESVFTAGVISRATGIQANAAPEKFLASAIEKRLVRGALLQSWWERQAGDVAFKVKNNVRTWAGTLAAQSGDISTADLIAKLTIDGGPFDIAKKNSDALIVTSMQEIINSTRMEVFNKNADLIEGITWVTMLDSRVCPQCKDMEGLSWTLEGAPIGVHTMTFEEPPLHFNDRCILSVIFINQ